MIQSISTKTGDAGTSALANGQRLPKTHQVFEVLGDLDELNSWAGWILSSLKAFQTQKEKKSSKETLDFIEKTIKQLENIQHDLYLISAKVAQAPKINFPEKSLITLEKNSHDIQESLADNWHTKFLAPGGTNLSSKLDITRAVCRRTERAFFVLQEFDKQDKNFAFSSTIPKYFNRLSDYLYLLRCKVNEVESFLEKEMALG